MFLSSRGREAAGERRMFKAEIVEHCHSLVIRGREFIGLPMMIVVARWVPPSHGSTSAMRVVNGTLTPPASR
jgi:hypothetical protein